MLMKKQYTKSMCGILASIGKIQTDEFIKALELLHHRGPDQLENYQSKNFNVNLGASRLSIQDIPKGQQPMTSQDDRYVLVWNGEIFNANEIRNNLLNLGVKFTSNNSDTEVLLNSLIIWGHSALEKLNGMFAFCFFDNLTGEMVAGRDQFGIKPLYIYQKEELTIFSSEIGAILELRNLRPTVKQQQIGLFLDFGFVPGVETGFNEVSSVPIGVWIKFNSLGKEISRNVFSFKSKKNISVEKNILESLRFSIQNAVRRWSISDVPITLSLSGGLDSSIIAMESRHLKIPINRVYTAVFTDIPNYNLNDYLGAKAVSKICKFDLQIVEISGKLIEENLEKMVWHLGEPYGGSIPSWFIYKEMSKAFKVCLTGSGGDEIFGQYGKWIPIGERLNGKLLNFQNSPFKFRAKYQLKKLLYYSKLTNIELRKNLSRQFSKSNNWSETYPLSERYSDHYLNSELRKYNSLTYLNNLKINSNLPPHEIVQEVDFATQLPDEFLLMTDRFSMAHSVEARTPYLDQELVKFTKSIPIQYFGTPHDPKKILRDAYRGILPDIITNNPKNGFTVPLKQYLNSNLKSKLLHSIDVLMNFYPAFFNLEALSSLTNDIKNYKDFDTLLAWRLMMFGIWTEVFLLNRKPVI